MAELGLAASIITVLQIATSVAKHAHEYGQSIKNATQDMLNVLDQLKDIFSILVKLKDLVDRETKAGKPLDSWAALLSLNKPDGALEQCRIAMTALCAELTPAKGYTAKIRQYARWPSTKKKVEKRLEKIRSLKNVFLEHVLVEQMEQSLKISNTLSHISNARNNSKKTEIIRWLSRNVDHDANQKAARKKHEDDTGKWFTNSEEFVKWKEEPNAFLWLHGLPGCGKTILCSEIIEQTQLYCADLPTNRQLAYFYFSFQDTEKQKVANLLRSILSQLMCQAEYIPDLLMNLYDNYLLTQLPTDLLLSTVKYMIISHMHTFVIIDALDECPKKNEERSELCNLLREMKGWTASNLHVLFTSRREVDLVESLDQVCTVGSISIQGEGVQSDIRKFICAELLRNKRLSIWPTEIQDEIEYTLVQGAHGMFRWVDLQLDSLKKCLTYSDVKKALTSLLNTLSESYERILLAIDEEHRQKALIALQWISHCCRPITIEELAEAVIIDPSATQPFNPHDRIPKPSWLLEILSGLVVVTKTNRRLDWDYEDFVEPKYILAVEIAHFSVKEYLNSGEAFSGPAGTIHTMKQSPTEAIIQRSLLYLNYYSMSDRKSTSLHDLDGFPFLLYASHFWHEHVLAAGDTISPEIRDLVYEFLTSEMPLLSWLKVYHADDDPSKPFSIKDREFAPPLYYLAFWGADHLVREMIDAGADVNAEGGLYHTALQAAAFNGNTNILKVLLENGAKVNIIGGEYGTALQAASWSGCTSGVKLLLTAGADVKAQGGMYGTALHAAASGNYAEIVAMLIAAGADVNVDVEPRGTAIDAAFECDADEHIAVIELLIAAGADISELDDEDIKMIRVMGSSPSLV